MNYLEDEIALLLRMEETDNKKVIRLKEKIKDSVEEAKKSYNAFQQLQIYPIHSVELVEKLLFGLAGLALIVIAFTILTKHYEITPVFVCLLIATGPMAFKTSRTIQILNDDLYLESWIELLDSKDVNGINRLLVHTNSNYRIQELEETFRFIKKTYHKKEIIQVKEELK